MGAWSSQVDVQAAACPYEPCGDRVATSKALAFLGKPLQDAAERKHDFC